MKAGRNLFFVAVLVVLVVCGSARSSEPIPGPIAHWEFEEGEGSIAYDSAGDNDGTLVNGPTWTSGTLDGALSFDGFDDYVEISDDASLRFSQYDSFTICFWALPTGNGGNIFGKYRASFQHGVFGYKSDWSDGKSAFRFVAEKSYTGRTDLYTPDDSAPAGSWYHVTCVYENKDMKIYLNGQINGSGTFGYDTGSTTPDENATIGARAYDSTIDQYFNGTIDEVAVWNRALSAEEVEELYEEEAPDLAALEVMGPNEVAENFHAQYKAIGHYDNNSTKDVTDFADWSVEPETVASIDAGLLTTAEIVSGEEDITILAEYTEGDVTADAEKPVTVYAVCPSGSALFFDGTNDYVDSNDFDLAEQYSICLWVNPTTTADEQCFIGKHTSGDDNIVVLGFYNGGYHVRIRGDWITVGVKTSGWQHFAVVASEIDGSQTTVAVYKNASLLWSGILNDVAGNMSGKGWTIGQDWDKGKRTDFFEGTIDEVVLFDRALSSEEIRTNMQRTLSGEEPNLAAYWDFDEGEGQIVYDLSGNSNHGWLGSAPYADSSDPAWVVSNAPVGLCAIPVAVDIKPVGCPNPFNVVSRSVLPAAILGSEDFEVSLVDSASVQLAGVSAIRSGIEDVATPVLDGDECACSEDGPDSWPDLTLKFETRAILGAIGDVNDGDVLPLTLTGVLQDGTLIEGTDCVVIRGRHKPFNKGDINKDGIVNIVDFALMAENWLDSTFIQY